jgi:tetratricopeptide (TPR) repeat protein
VCHLALLVPVLGMESFRHYHATDRYSYLQGISWSVVIAAVALWAVQRSRWRTTMFAGVLVWTSFCAVLIPSQISIWKDSVSLHSQIVASLGRNPDRRPGSRALRDLAQHETFLGQLQLQLKDSAGAEASLRNAMATAPTLQEPFLSLGELLAGQGRTAEAIGCVETLLQNHPNDVRGRLMLAVFMGQSGKLPESAKQFEEIIRMAPSDASAHHNYAVTLERLGNTNAAATHYARAAELRARQTASR